jgi:hypothetical protein
MGPGDVGAEPGPRRRGLEHPDRLDLALEHGRRELGIRKHRLGRLVCGEADRDGGIGGDRLDARRRVDRVAGEEALARARRDAEPDEDLARVDADPEPERCLAQGRHVGCVLADPERGPDRTFGVVLVGRRHPEHAEDRVADELLDHPAVRLDMVACHRGVGGEHAVDVFRVGALRRGGETDEVAEQCRHDLALLRERHGPVCQWGAAAVAEPRSGRVPDLTDGADDHDVQHTDTGWRSGGGRRPGGGAGERCSRNLTIPAPDERRFPESTRRPVPALHRPDHSRLARGPARQGPSGQRSAEFHEPRQTPRTRIASGRV